MFLNKKIKFIGIVVIFAALMTIALYEGTYMEVRAEAPTGFVFVVDEEVEIIYVRNQEQP